MAGGVSPVTFPILVTAADGAAQHYKRIPESHCPETPEQSIRLDRLLEQVWGGHPRYYRIDNVGLDWAQKSRAAQEILDRVKSDSHL